jgi:hydrogenase nickel incorporation protein HypB
VKKEIPVGLPVRERNDLIAGENRKFFQGKKLRVLNVIGSPGCGKTSILEYSARKLGKKLAVIEGDLATAQDAQRILAAGSAAVQIETGGGCHLNAEQVQKALGSLDLSGVEVLIIENVGNLVCPAAYDLGEDAKVAVLSLPEGDEKPSKYPNLFLRADLVLINKMDLKPVMDYDIGRVRSDCKKLNAQATILEVSAKTGEGMGEWMGYVHGKGKS